MKNKEKNKQSTRGLYLRGCRTAYKIDKKLFWSETFNAIGGTVRPFFNSIMAALVIDGVMAGKSAKTLILYAVLCVGVNFLVNVVIQYTAGKRYIRKSMWQQFISMFFNSYSEKMDYAHLEDIKVKELKYRVDRYNSSWEGIGAIMISHVHSFSRAIFGTSMSAAIIVAMLASKPSGEVTGAFAFVNSGYAVIIFALVIALDIFFTYLTSYKERLINNDINNFWSSKSKRFWNVKWFLFDTQRAADTKIYGLSGKVLSETDKFIGIYTPNQNKSLLKMNLLGSFERIKTLLLLLAIYAFVSLKALSGAFGIGSVVLYVTTCAQFSDAFSYFGNLIGKIKGSRKILEEQFAYIDMENEMYKGTLTVEKRRDRDYDVEFRDVSFKYPGTETYALRHISIKFKIGERLAVVGMNGSGKTTFIKLMCRLYDPTEGQILLNGIDIKKYDYTEYMSVFSVVFQDFKLFAYPLCENVAVGKNYNEGRVISCLIEAGMGERVKTLPKGIETCLYKQFDKDGVEISGGEAQKIALARALYKNAPFIILDEPTAALDPIAEAEVYSKFNEIVGDKTAIYISHRLSSCRFCDKIAVFDKGEIVQTGTHDELVSLEDGKYSELWTAQAQYYTKSEETAENI